MKKLSLVFAAMLVMGSIMAQSVSNVTQVGPSNAATVGQTGVNLSDISQANWAIPGHQATVTQIKNLSGTRNISEIIQEQRGADVIVRQEGAENVSRLVQAGPNSANIDQKGTGNILGGLTFTGQAYQANGTSFNNDKNELNLIQTGDLNKAGVSQQHYATAKLTQIGAYNEVKVNQYGGAVGILNTAEVMQVGDLNKASITQFDEGNRAMINVLGSNNTTNIYQHVVDNYAIIKAVGSDNTVNVNQFTVTTLGNRAYLDMAGSNNMVNFTQSGSWNQIGGKDMFPDKAFAAVTAADMLSYKGSNSTIDMTQSGNQNLIKSKMKNDSGDIDITQDGNVNITTLFINAAGSDPIGFNNDAHIMQTGTGNISNNNVTGSNNTINVTQN